MEKKSVERALKDYLVIVSGIPRSGTSLLMQMLRAGGVEILSDHQREADRSNPKGYFELEAVKSLAKDNSCLKNQTGKAVKVISSLLKYLPKDQNYKVIFINRNIQEIIRSQQKMLDKIVDKYPKSLLKIFNKKAQRVKDWAENQPNIDICNFHYEDIIENPQKEVDRIINFLNAPLRKERMINVIDPSLYRTKV